MKTLFPLCLSLLLTSIPTNAQEGWYLQNTPTSEHLNSVFFIDSLYGWAVGNNDVILHTKNGGDDWTFQAINHPSLNRLYDVYFTTRLKGSIVGWNASLIISTTDGGENWYYQSNLNGTPQFKIHFSDSLNGWSIGSGEQWHDSQYYMMHTSDGGVTWFNQFDGYYFYLNSIFFIDEITGWAVGSSDNSGGGVIFRSVNGGYNWNIEQLSGIEELNELFLLDQNSGWIAGWSGIYFTSDGGLTWDNQLPLYTVYDIFFTDRNKGWAIGNYNYEWRILHTTDAGNNWGLQQSGTTERLNSFYFTDRVNGWIVGNNGAILHTRDGGGITNVDKDIDETPSNYYLRQNYPNPFNPSTTISYSVPELEFVTLKVYDVLGNEIATLVNKEKPAGSYEVEFNPASGNLNLVSGIYFYQLKAGSFIQTKKMILLK